MTAASRCTCSLRGQLLGDGCEVCNPAIALDYAKERIADLEKALHEIRAEAGSHTVALHLKPQRGSGMPYVFKLADEVLN